MEALPSSVGPTPPPRRRGPVRPATDRSPVDGVLAAMLTALVDAGGDGLDQDDLAAVLWPDLRPAHWQGLMSLYRGWLQGRLPAGWIIERCGDRYVLRSPAGAVCDLMQAAFSVDSATCDGDDCNHGVLEPSSLSGPLVVITGPRESEQVSALHRSFRQGDTSHTQIITGGVAETLALGDLAAALPSIRWELLDLDKGSRHATAAAAWRLIIGMIADSSSPTAALTFVEAHRLDDVSMQVVQLLIDYPRDESFSIVLCGDDHSVRPKWLDLLVSAQRSATTHIAICAGCDGYVLRPVHGFFRTKERAAG